MWSRLAYLEADPSLPELPAVGRSKQNAAVGNVLAAHEHPEAFELVLVSRGRLNWWVENERLTLSAGALFCTRPGESHGAVDKVLEPSEILWAQFRLDLNNAFGLNNAARREIARQLWHANRSGRATTHQYQHLLRILQERQRANPRNWLIRSRAVCFLSEVVEALTGPDAADPDPRIEKAIENLRRDIGRRIAIPRIAASVGLSQSWFHHLFRKSTGLSAADWLNRERAERAKELLCGSDLSVTEIAFELGYSSSQYFATSFKRQTGLSPQEWRRSAARPQFPQMVAKPVPTTGLDGSDTARDIRPALQFHDDSGLTRRRKDGSRASLAWTR